MRYQDDINTEHNMKSIGSAAVAQWTKRLTRNGQTRVQIREAHIFDITISVLFRLVVGIVSASLYFPVRAVSRVVLLANGRHLLIETLPPLGLVRIN